MERIHTITLNPAIDRILYLDTYKPEVTNRLKETVDGLGGKGTHVSINLSQMGVPNQALGIVYGNTGRRIMELLDQDGIDVHFQHFPDQESRANYLIVEDSGKCTCLSAKGIPLTTADIDNFIAYIDPEIGNGDYLVFSGDASNCPDPWVYNHIMKAFSDRNLKVFMDASGETLKKCIEEKPFLIKPNTDELSYLCGQPMEIPEDVQKGIESLQHWQIPVIAVSMGAEGSIVCVEGTMYRVISPQVHVNNTIGCGDCFLAGLIYGIWNNLPVEEMLAHAAAVSSACAESVLSVGFDAKRAEQLVEQVRIRKL